MNTNEWANGMLKEVPWWRDDITPDEYEDERYYFRYHYEEWKHTGYYKTLYQQQNYLNLSDADLQEYARICKKVGFDLRDWHPKYNAEEDDRPSPLAKLHLNIDELHFLQDHGLFSIVPRD